MPITDPNLVEHVITRSVRDTAAFLDAVGGADPTDTYHDGQQGWGNRGYPDGDLGGEFVDLVGEQPEVLHRRSASRRTMAPSL